MSAGADGEAGLHPIRIALLSVADKRGLLPLAIALDRLGVTVGCTDGTFGTLYTQGLETELLSRYVRPLLGGRVRTQYPELHGPIAARVDELAALAEVGLEPIDLVVCNPAWFAITSGRPDVTLATAAEDIDGGGIELIRAAAKNHARVAVVVDPDDYPAILDELAATGGALGAATRRRLAAKAFAATAAHDALVASWLADVPDRAAGGDAAIARPRLPALVTGPWRRAALPVDDRSGGGGALYVDPPPAIATDDEPAPTIGAAAIVAGRPHPLAPATIRELDRALAVVRELDGAPAGAAAVIVRADEPAAASALAHPLPALRHVLGFADPDDVAASGRRDPAGGALALDVPITRPLVRWLAASAVDAIVAPAIADDARAAWPADGPAVLIAAGRWHDGPWGRPELPALGWRSIAGGLLVQERDGAPIAALLAVPVTARVPTDDERRDLALAARVARHVRAHALVIARAAGTVAISGGAPDLRRALLAAEVEAGPLLAGAAAAVSARIEAPLEVEALAAAGVRAIWQPGGGPTDVEVIAAADRHHVAMVMAGIEHLRR
jgi:phosphoribosylaminoimidazolecarboxamide formyltransferase/IMP cyclohydrolase